MQAGDAEVHHLDVAVGVEHHVLRLDVAVDDALAVRVGERVEQLDADGDDVAVAELAGQLVQRLALDELPDEDAALAVAEPVVERDDVGVRRAPRRPRPRARRAPDMPRPSATILSATALVEA